MNEEELKVFVGKRLAQARVANEYSKRKLAKVLGVSQPAIHQFEETASGISLFTLYRLADILHVSLDWLCGREDAHPQGKGGERVEEETLAQRIAYLEADVRVLERTIKFHLGVLTKDLDRQKQLERAKAGAPPSTSDAASALPSQDAALDGPRRE